MGIGRFSFNYDQNLRFVDGQGRLLEPARDFFLSLFNRTGGGDGLPSVQIGVIAVGSSQADAFLLTGDWNYVETVASGAGVLIPPLQVGADCVVWNAGANSLSVYPSVVAATAGGPVQIDALGNNNPYPLAAGKMQWFRQVKASLIKSAQLG